MPEEGITTLVFMEDTLTIGYNTSTFFPMLEVVPLVDKETLVGGFPLVMEGTRKFETNGIFWVSRAGMEG